MELRWSTEVLLLEIKTWWR